MTNTFKNSNTKFKIDLLKNEINAEKNASSKEDSKYHDLEDKHNSVAHQPEIFTIDTKRRIDNHSKISNSININQGYSRRPSINNKSNEIKGSRNNSKKITYTQRQLISTCDRVIEVINLRKKVKEDYLKITPKTYASGKKNILNKWRSVVRFLQALDVKIFLISIKILADIYLEFDEYETAKNFYFYYKYLANNLDIPEEIQISYECLGNTYKFLFQYHKAIKCYKKQIEVAWVLNNKNSELRAYDNIGIQYFYLGNKDKAKYYHERMLYGRSENVKSETREKVAKNFKNKNFHLFIDEKYIKKNRSNEELKEKLKYVIVFYLIGKLSPFLKKRKP